MRGIFCLWSIPEKGKYKNDRITGGIKKSISNVTE